MLICQLYSGSNSNRACRLQEGHACKHATEKTVTGFFAMGYFAVGHFAVGQCAKRTVHRRDPLLQNTEESMAKFAVDANL